MSEESTTPDLIERVRGLVGALDRCDLDTFVSFLAPDSVLAAEVGRFEGVAAIRGFIEDWLANYEEFAVTLEEVRDLGNGVTFGVFRQQGRLVGSSGHVQLRHAAVYVWVDGVIARAITGPDIDEARAAAERLAEERANG
jgi:ketosteroid isomerase-like protein